MKYVIDFGWFGKECTYDGDVFIVTNDAKQISLKEWEEMNFQRSNENQG